MKFDIKNAPEKSGAFCSHNKPRFRLCFFPHLCEARAAINRAVLTGSERNLCFCTAFCASRYEHFTFAAVAVFACVAAGFAALGFINETLLRIEFLLSCCEDEFFVAVLACECFVFVHFFNLA